EVAPKTSKPVSNSEILFITFTSVLELSLLTQSVHARVIDDPGFTYHRRTGPPGNCTLVNEPESDRSDGPETAHEVKRHIDMNIPLLRSLGEKRIAERLDVQCVFPTSELIRLCGLKIDDQRFH